MIAEGTARPQEHMIRRGLGVKLGQG